MERVMSYKIFRAFMDSDLLKWNSHVYMCYILKNAW